MKLLPFQDFFWGQARICKRFNQSMFLCALLPFQKGKGNGLPTIFLAQFVQATIVRHAIEPGLERYTCLQFWQRDIELKKDRLQDISYQILVLEDSPHVATEG